MLNGGDNQHLVDGILKSVQNLSSILGKDNTKSILYAVAYKKTSKIKKRYSRGLARSRKAALLTIIGVDIILDSCT